jgi:glycosyltransferase involved in cell wall biosynthesis
MNRLRVVLVTPRFWPLFGGPEDVVAELALGLKRRGAEPTVVTARWDAHWSSQLVYGPVPVIRLPHPRTRGWGTLRYLIALARWLRNHRDQVDLIYLVGLGHEATVAHSALAGCGIPIVVRPDVPEDRDGPSPSRWRLRRRCHAADAAIVGDLGAARALADAGLPQQAIHTIVEGLPESMLDHAGQRAEARESLADVNPMLAITAEARVVVCVGRLTKGRGLLRLIEAWRPLSRQWPAWRLWLIGDGPFREPLYARLGDLDLRLSVNMPGSFDDLGDVLAAANLLVDPCGESTSPRIMLQAIALRLPVVGCNLETLRQTPALDSGTGRFASALEAAELSQAMLEMLIHPPPGEALAAAGQRVVREYGSERMIDDHLQLFECLCRKDHGGQPVVLAAQEGQKSR